MISSAVGAVTDADGAPVGTDGSIPTRIGDGDISPCLAGTAYIPDAADLLAAGEAPGEGPTIDRSGGVVDDGDVATVATFP